MIRSSEAGNTIRGLGREMDTERERERRSIVLFPQQCVISPTIRPTPHLSIFISPSLRRPHYPSPPGRPLHLNPCIGGSFGQCVRKKAEWPWCHILLLTPMLSVCVARSPLTTIQDPRTKVPVWGEKGDFFSPSLSAASLSACAHQLLNHQVSSWIVRWNTECRGG